MSHKLYETSCGWVVNPTSTDGKFLNWRLFEYSEKDYAACQKYCESQEFRVGRLFTSSWRSYCIIHLAVKEHWWESITMENAFRSLMALRSYIDDWGIHSVAVPLFTDHALMKMALEKPGVIVEIYPNEYE